MVKSKWVGLLLGFAVTSILAGILTHWQQDDAPLGLLFGYMFGVMLMGLITGSVNFLMGTKSGVMVVAMVLFYMRFALYGLLIYLALQLGGYIFIFYSLLGLGIWKIILVVQSLKEPK